MIVTEYDEMRVARSERMSSHRFPLLVVATSFTYAECVPYWTFPWNSFRRQHKKHGAIPPGFGSRFDPKKQRGSPIPAYSFIMPRNSQRPLESPFSSRSRMTATPISSGCPRWVDCSHE
jgi:hypothetical protein